MNGGPLLSKLLAWLLLLVISSLVVQVLVTTFMRWLSVLAPWLLLTLFVAATAGTAVAVMRRRFYRF